jgi:hypothetical protein
MRSVGLDLGARHIAYCEVRAGQVVDRVAVTRLEELASRLGNGTAPACVAFEAAREAWHVHDVLTQWGHQPKIVDTTRLKTIGVGQHKRKNDAIDAERVGEGCRRGGGARHRGASRRASHRSAHIGLADQLRTSGRSWWPRWWGRSWRGGSSGGRRWRRYGRRRCPCSGQCRPRLGVRGAGEAQSGRSDGRGSGEAEAVGPIGVGRPIGSFRSWRNHRHILIARSGRHPLSSLEGDQRGIEPATLGRTAQPTAPVPVRMSTRRN